jgi:hypothetical protein
VRVVPVDPEPEEAPAVAEVEVAPPAPEPPSFDPAPWSGVWRGERSGRPLALELTFDAEGGVSGSATVTVGPRQLGAALSGTWTRQGDALAVELSEIEGPRPATYQGALGASTGGGEWSERGRTRGSWEAAR